MSIDVSIQTQAQVAGFYVNRRLNFRNRSELYPRDDFGYIDVAKGMFPTNSEGVKIPGKRGGVVFDNRSKETRWIITSEVMDAWEAEVQANPTGPYNPTPGSKDSVFLQVDENTTYAVEALLRFCVETGKWVL